jgi:hypothetical protein
MTTPATAIRNEIRGHQRDVNWALITPEAPEDAGHRLSLRNSRRYSVGLI